MPSQSQTSSDPNRSRRAQTRWKEYLSALGGVVLAILFFSLFRTVDTTALYAPPKKGFQLCFLGRPNLPLPSEVKENLNTLQPIIDRISLQFEHGAENRSLVLALAAVESGGRIRSVNPLGFGGLFASSNQGDAPPCCVKDDEDGYHYEYDLCNSERVFGLRCDFDNDPRFRVESEITQMFQRLEYFRTLLEPRIRNGETVDLPSALTAFWNSGPGSVADFPSHLGSPQKFFEALDITSSGGYENWSTAAVVTRLAETFDHVADFERILSKDSKSLTGPGSLDDSTLICWNYLRSVSGKEFQNTLQFYNGSESSLKRTFLPKIRLQRLDYGMYSFSDAWIDLNLEMKENGSSETYRVSTP